MDKFGKFCKFMNAAAFVLCGFAAIVNFVSGSYGFAALNAGLAVMNLMFYMQD